MSVAVIGAVAVIIASIIGLIVAVTTAVIAKEQKVSEFRQAWINDFREDTAAFITAVCDCMHALEGIAVNKKFKKDIMSLQVDYNSSYKEAELRAMMLQLRLNPSKDKQCINYIDELKRMLDSVTTDSSNVKYSVAINEIKVFNTIFKDEVHSILKNEWEIVKQGEKRFLRFTNLGKFLASTLMVAIYVLFVIALVKSPVLSF